MNIPFASSPDATLLLFTAGVMLLYLEFNRPGLILPGAAGLTLILITVARFLRLPIPLPSAASGILAFVLFAVSTRSRRHYPIALLATTILLYSVLHLAPASSPARPHAFVAILCALFLGGGTTLLTTIAARARQNKGLDLK